MDFLSDSDDEDVDIESDSEVEDSDFEMKLLKTKLRIRVKKNEHLKKVYIPRESVQNIEIDFYNFDEHLAAFITSFPNLKSMMLLAVDDYFFDDTFITMAAGLPLLTKMDIRIWEKLDPFDYNEYDMEDSSLDTVYQLMGRCNKLKLVKVLSKFDFRFSDLDDYNSVGSDKAKKTLEDFGSKLKTEKPRWKFEYDIPVIDNNGTGYSYTMKKAMRLVSDSYTERFDPLIISPVPITALQSWGRKDDLHFKPTDYSALEVARHRVSPFPVSDSINNRFIIWEGDISLLKADAITNTTDETLTEKNIISDRIFSRAGPGLKQELLNEIKECKTGEVLVTHGYNLPAKYIIHTVGPIYSDRYKTAAETTLHSCYRNILCKAKEVGFKSIAICVVSTVQRNFPPDIGAHIALRTIRRFLEQYKNETIVLCLEPHERGIFEVIAPLYFPRDKLEESSALWQLPKDIGGSFGEPQIHDRQIRIIHNPQHSVMIGTDDESDENPHNDLDGGLDIDYKYSNGFSLSSHLNIGQHSFSQMQGDLDRQRLLGDRPRANLYENIIEEGIEGIEHQERYERLLHRARTEDLTEVSGIGCLYQSGIDRLGRPVVVFCGKWFPAQNIDLEKALLYLIYLLDPIVKGDYVIAYFHTLTSSNNYPSLHWLRDVYSILPYKYKKNLKAFYIVHPTFWTKMMTWWFLTFMAPAIKAKVHQLPGVEHLYAAITKDQLEIPAYITEYDMATNGLHYFQPITQNSSSDS